MRGMTEQVGQERRLSRQDYDRRLVALHADAARELAAGKNPELVAQELEDGEFNLAIDARLGTKTPANIRQALHTVRKRIRARRKELAGRFQQKQIGPVTFALGVNGLVKEALKSVGQEIPASTAKLMFGLPALIPIDIKQLIAARLENRKTRRGL